MLLPFVQVDGWVLQVAANDLNPDSHRYLVKNIQRNRLAHAVQPFCMDGRAFIRNVCQGWPQRDANAGNCMHNEAAGCVILPVAWPLATSPQSNMAPTCIL